MAWAILENLLGSFRRPFLLTGEGREGGRARYQARLAYHTMTTFTSAPKATPLNPPLYDGGEEESCQ